MRADRIVVRGTETGWMSIQVGQSGRATVYANPSSAASVRECERGPIARIMGTQMKNLIVSIAAVLIIGGSSEAACPYDPNCLSNPYGAGNPYNLDRLKNPYSQYGSQYSDKSWTNPYAIYAPELFDQDGNNRGWLSTNRYDPDSLSDPFRRYENPFGRYKNLFGRYGNSYSPDSLNYTYGAGNRYSNKTIFVQTSR